SRGDPAFQPPGGRMAEGGDVLFGPRELYLRKTSLFCGWVAPCDISYRETEKTHRRKETCSRYCQILVPHLREKETSDERSPPAPRLSAWFAKLPEPGLSKRW